MLPTLLECSFSPLGMNTTMCHGHELNAPWWGETMFSNVTL